MGNLTYFRRLEFRGKCHLGRMTLSFLIVTFIFVAFDTITIVLPLEVSLSLNHVFLTILCVPLICCYKIKCTSFMMSSFISTSSLHFLFFTFRELYASIIVFAVICYMTIIVTINPIDCVLSSSRF